MIIIVMTIWRPTPEPKSWVRTPKVHCRNILLWSRHRWLLYDKDLVAIMSLNKPYQTITKQTNGWSENYDIDRTGLDIDLFIWIWTVSSRAILSETSQSVQFSFVLIVNVQVESRSTNQQWFTDLSGHSHGHGHTNGQTSRPWGEQQLFFARDFTCFKGQTYAKSRVRITSRPAPPRSRKQFAIYSIKTFLATQHWLGDLEQCPDVQGQTHRLVARVTRV